MSRTTYTRWVASLVSLFTLALAIFAAQPAPWPMFCHDVQHTGRSSFSGPATATKKWAFSTTGEIWSSPSVGADGTVYVGSSDNKLYAINPDGTQQWAFLTGQRIVSSPALGTDGTVYVGSSDSKVYAVNPDGTLRWAFSAGDGFAISSSPALGADGTIYIGSEDGKVCAINPDGSQQWTFTTGDFVQSSPAIGADGTIYVGSADGKLYAINPDGSPQWSFTTGGVIRSSPSLGADGAIYFGSYDHHVYALNPDGSFRWAFAATADVFSTPALGTDGTIYAGSLDGKFYAINPDGTLRWTVTAGGGIASSPAIGGDGTIYFGAYDKKFYAIKADGTPRWIYMTGGMIDTSPTIGADGTVFIGSDDHKLYAFGISAPVRALTLLAPNGGEQWAAGSTQSIKWTSTGNPGALKLELYNAGAFDSLLADNVADTGSYSWTIPAIQTPGANYRVKISADADATIAKQSAADFAITPVPTLTLTAPNGGEQWQAGSTQTISWTSTGSVGTVKIVLNNAGTLDSVIADNVANTGKYAWTLSATQTPGTNYQVQISADANATITAQSAANFTITAKPIPTLTLLTPNGGEQWQAGSKQQITWTSANNPGALKIMLYNAGSPDSLLADKVPDTGVFTWSIPATQAPGASYQVNISADADATITAQSAADFTITPLPTLTLTAPNGGEQWVAGSAQTITWTSTNTPGTLQLALYRAGALDSLIADNVPDTGSYTWNIPVTQTAGGNYRVKISADANVAATVQSAADFAIKQPTVASLVFTPAPGTYTDSVTVNVTCTTAGAKIRYLLNGSEPTITSPIFQAPIVITGNTTIKAKAYLNGYTDSTTAMGVYTIIHSVATPVFTPPPGTYTGAVAVSISCTTPGATIFFTTDGTPPTPNSLVYAGPITLLNDTQLQAIAVAKNMANSPVISGMYTVTPQVAIPTFSPNSGVYLDSVSVNIFCGTSGAEIHYTLDGSTPTIDSPLFTAPLVITNTTVLKAKAFLAGYQDSSTATATYTLEHTLAAPVFTPSPGTYGGSVSVSISSGFSGAVIHYTVDGSTPISASPIYSAPIVLGVTTTLKAIATASGMINSPVTTGNYTIIPITGAPIVNPASGAYPGPLVITITPATPGSIIRYTLDSTDPNVGSPQVSQSKLLLTQSATLKAQAYCAGLAPSPITTRTYTLVNPRVAMPVISPASGSYTGSVSVSMACATSGATIRYTLNGSTPTSSSPAYTNALLLTATTTVKACAFKSGYPTSFVAVATFHVNSDTDGQDGTPAQAIPISNGQTLLQSIDLPGDTEWSKFVLTQQSQVSICVDSYSDSMELLLYQPNDPTKLLDHAVGQGATITRYGARSLTPGTYYVQVQTASDAEIVPAFFTLTLRTAAPGQVDIPTVSPLPGIFTGPVQVTLASIIPGTEIHYTIDGSDPTILSTKYTSPILLTSTTTIKAKCFCNGYTENLMAVATYNISGPTSAKASAVLH